MNYTEKDLPTGKDIHARLKEVKGCTSSKLDELKDYLFGVTDVFTTVVDDFVSNNEFVEDPELVIDKLLKFHYINSGLLGLAVAVERQSFYGPYKEMFEQSANATSTKSKMTQKDRELFAKGEAAAVEGLVQILEKYDRNIYERIQTQKGSIRKW